METFVDKDADLVVHPVLHIQLVQLPMHDFRHRISVRYIAEVPA